ncbi:MAG: hypothetical protein R6U66_02755 [Bacteroidales bacterium]
MFKQLMLVFNFLVLLVLSALFAGNVNLSMDAATQIEAGQELMVEIKLEKEDLSSFARFQQELPPGLTPEAVDPQNADFSFEDQKLTFLWLRLPDENSFAITYKLKVDERLKGQFDLGGKFSYIADNKRMHKELAPQNITITPSANVAPELIVDIADFRNLERPAPAMASAQVRCLRQVPYKVADEEAYRVNLLVFKGDKEKFAKIEEAVPQGYVAKEIDTKEAIFSFKDNTVKFLWMNLPAEPYFTVSYKLVPETAETQKPELNGQFSYIVNRSTQSITIEQEDVNLEDIGDNQVASLLSTPKPLISEVSFEDSYTPPSSGGKVKIEIAEKAKRMLAQEVEGTNQVLEPQNGIYYRVQIAAGHRPINIERYFRKYNLDKEVRTEFHEGWRKYSVGSFDIYKSARDYRVHIWNTTTINDAFVSAYNDGQRITVQEALMITNHKWYR